MSSALENRNKKVEEFLQRVNNSTNEVLQIRKSELDPKRYLVGEYDSGDLVWFGQSTHSTRRKTTLTTTKLAHLGTSPFLI